MLICTEDDPPTIIDTSNTEFRLQDLQADIKEARELAFRKVNSEKRSPWLSDETLDLIKERQRTREEMNGGKEGGLYKAIKYAIRKDKRRYWKEKLDKEVWREVKLTKNEYTLKHTRLKHADGTVDTSRERPEMFADFFEEAQGEEF